ncbi:Nickel uptake substrate-specific transmembrane region [Lacunisphaera limnophila]|uniref:Nickel uptake substrate-specific transmembrane region n=1 Tax=Lacunisphaera limnophila TaxID=1838286 RepID=A0A1D8ARL7_9BACT|nr:DUF4198 domain-containing protein [Lacunisphaera limnophila]AOS43520.1 Nickel uptake substrate-specific transmembrane region [Lacunisphaera limnophila]
MLPRVARFLLLTCPVLLAAHECWLQPSRFDPVPGQELGLRLNVGMNFQGEARPFNPQRAARLAYYSAAGAADWTGKTSGQTELDFSLPTPGTHVLALDSGANLITLEAEKFNAYLKEEGLTSVLAQREQAGETNTPGKERYIRHIKTLLQAGGRSDDTWQIRTGQRLELVPLNNPATVHPGGTQRVQLLFAGQPLADNLVRAWHRAGDKLTVIDVRTSASGEAAFTLPAAGAWMLSTVHMARVTGDAQADWESLWGNLTFAITEPAPAHPVKGVIMGIMTEKTALLVKHEEVPGVMRAMTMMFKVDPAVLTRVKRTDAIRGKMQRRPDGWWLLDVEVLPPAK